VSPQARRTKGPALRDIAAPCRMATAGLWPPERGAKAQTKGWGCLRRSRPRHRLRLHSPAKATCRSNTRRGVTGATARAAPSKASLAIWSRKVPGALGLGPATARAALAARADVRDQAGPGANRDARGLRRFRSSRAERGEGSPASRWAPRPLAAQRKPPRRHFPRRRFEALEHACAGSNELVQKRPPRSAGCGGKLANGAHSSGGRVVSQSEPGSPSDRVGAAADGPPRLLVGRRMKP
jgi:hypothetical protein